MKVAKILIFPDASKLKKEFPIMEIEQDDINKIQDLCQGFVRGTTVEALYNVLQTGESLSTFSRRKLESANATQPEKASAPSKKKSISDKGIPQTIYLPTKNTFGTVEKATWRDRSINSPNGMGVYFRFVPRKKKEAAILNALRGAGGSSPVAFYMELQQTLHKKITTMGSGDFKYGYTSETAFNMWQSCAQNCNSNYSQTEIAFYKRVLISDIQKIFITIKSLKENPAINTLMESRGFRQVVAANTEKPVVYQANQKQWYMYENINLSLTTVSKPSAASTPST